MVLLSFGGCAFPKMEVGQDGPNQAGSVSTDTSTEVSPIEANGGSLASGGTGTSTTYGAAGRTLTATGASSAGALAVASGGATTVATSALACRDNLETSVLVNGKSICVARMTTIVGPSGAGDYDIDVTEVTRSEYDSWLATNPPLPPKSDLSCGWNSSFAASANCMAGASVCKTGCADHPMVCLDWCDAYAYCSSVGKRLCGKIGGGKNAFVDHASAQASQWYRACSSDGANSFPYGNAFDGAACNGNESWNGASATTVAAGTRSTCRASVDGAAFDLSGNVLEWEDSCSSTTETSSCRLRGGAYDDNRQSSTCEYGFSYARNVVQSQVGFRCCS